VDRFRTAIPQRVAFRDAANKHRLAVKSDREVRELFNHLADELIERMPCESRRAAPIPR
jgi:hypothetical protein